jgi:GNAT superfamily N-acetyltransferase
MAEWVIERLRAAHDRASFSCGKPPLDNYLRALASQYERRRLGRTFVATEPGNPKVAGYYTLATGALDVNCLPEAIRKKLPRHPIPTVHLARLAVDLSFRGQRLGETLLYHALRQSLQVTETVAAYTMDLWAIDDEARAFYLRYGFLPLEDAALHLHLPLATVEAMFGSQQP